MAPPKTTPEHVRMRVRAGARGERCRVDEKGVWHVDVRARAIEGQANERALALVAAALHVPLEALRIVSGHRRPSKLLLIR